MLISGNQIRAARALAGLEQADLATRAGVSINTIRNMEAAGSAGASGRIETLGKIVSAFKSAGVIFIAENGEGPGVRLKKTSEPHGDNAE